MSNQGRETRKVDATLAEVRVQSDDDNAPTVVGYAALFDTETDIAGVFREKVSKGAFAEAIKRDDIHALYNHDYDHVLGRRSAGTLRLKEDGKGLHVEIDMPDTQTARDLATSMDRGDVDQMSFGFYVRKQEWDDTQDPPLRTILEVELFDVSVVPRGAYDDTEAALRSLEGVQAEAAATREGKEAEVVGIVRRRLKMKDGIRQRNSA